MSDLSHNLNNFLQFIDKFTFSYPPEQYKSLDKLLDFTTMITNNTPLPPINIINYNNEDHIINGNILLYSLNFAFLNKDPLNIYKGLGVYINLHTQKIFLDGSNRISGQADYIIKASNLINTKEAFNFKNVLLNNNINSKVIDECLESYAKLGSLVAECIIYTTTNFVYNNSDFELLKSSLKISR